MLHAIAFKIVRRMRTRQTAQALAAGGLMFLLAHAQMAGLAPFAAAFFAAGVVCAKSAGAMLIGCAAGIFRPSVSDIELFLPIGCAVMLGGFLVFDRLREREKISSETLASVLAVLGILPAGVFQAEADVYKTVLAICVSFVAGACARLFYTAFNIDFAREKWSKIERAAAAALYFAALIGLSGFGGDFPKAAGFALAGLLALAMAQDGPAAGALTGALGGAALVIGGANPIGAVALATGGACAGFLGGRGKLFSSPVFLLSGGLIGLYAPLYAPGPIPFAVSGVLRILLPQRWFDALRERMNPNERENAAARALADEQRRLRALADAFGELGEAYRIPTPVPDEQLLIAQMRESLCAGCTGYSDCWAGAENRAIRLLCQLISEAVGWDGKEPIFGEEIPPGIARVCRRAHMIPTRLSGLLMDFSDERRASVKRGDAYEMAARQFANAAGLLKSIGENGENRRAKRHVLRATWGASCLSMEAGQPSGDSHLVRFLSDGRLMILLADGMGSGEAAARESAQAVRLLWRLLSAEMDIALALNTVNEWMLSQGKEDMFVTVDLCLADLTDGRAAFLKLAASRSVILRGGEKILIDGGRLPLGVVEGVRPLIQEETFLPGDVLLMGTDGVMDAPGSAKRIEDELSGQLARTPADLAECAVRAIEDSVGRKDDMTCVCVRFARGKKVSEAAFYQQARARPVPVARRS